MLLVAAPFENLFENKARLPAGLGGVPNADSVRAMELLHRNCCVEVSVRHGNPHLRRKILMMSLANGAVGVMTGASLAMSMIGPWQ
jgi:hypothetical protein